ncbi:hypothetical protein M6B38_249360 [Iris pallida]|uniref:Uncharacterized protein n=1 Tax=Iris pallida TaxID=29817 RepID=A0AAX6IM39_IRIPA|nr:hypothetical protein M6B38_249360 [Iris pallida]
MATENELDTSVEHLILLADVGLDNAFDNWIGYDWGYSCAVSVGPANHRGFDRRRLFCSTWLTPSGLHIHIEVEHHV